jgi:hypothetical protein
MEYWELKCFLKRDIRHSKSFVLFVVYKTKSKKIKLWMKRMGDSGLYETDNSMGQIEKLLNRVIANKIESFNMAQVLFSSVSPTFKFQQHKYE